MNKKTTTIYVAYLRVSTRQQRKTGLGLESQKDAIESFAAQNGADIIETIVDIESAANKERISAYQEVNLEKLLIKRPGLLKAIRLAQETGAILLVKEASRLTRYSMLMEYLISSVKFICVDTPNDTAEHIRAATSFHELEAKKISIRTLAALAVLKKRGVKLGKPENFTDAMRRNANIIKSQNADDHPETKKVMDKIYRLRTKLRYTFQETADELNSEGYRSPRGKKFFPMTVYLLFHRKRRLLSEGAKLKTDTKNNN